MLRMGEYYLYDYDSLNESEKAFAYFKKAAEYEWYSEGLGICYEMGIGVEDNETEAFKYYTLAADNGNTMSMYRTGLCYYNGVGVKQNYAEAYRWFTDAAGNENIAYCCRKNGLRGIGFAYRGICKTVGALRRFFDTGDNGCEKLQKYAGRCTEATGRGSYSDLSAYWRQGYTSG